MRLKGKVALAVGAGGGIGKAVAFLASDDASRITGTELVVEGVWLAQ